MSVSQNFFNLLNIQAAYKKKIFRGSNSPFMTKTLRKAIMIRSRLKNGFNKTKSDENWLLGNTQRTFLTTLFRNDTKDHFSKVNQKFYHTIKILVQTIKMFFSDKGNFSNTITEIFFEHFISLKC